MSARHLFCLKNTADRSQLTRREWLRRTTAVATGSIVLGELPALAAGAGTPRSCIVLWMAGGPSQIDTFDLKPKHANGGPYREIETDVPGFRVSEHLPKIAQRSRHLAIVRSMNTKEGDHVRATDHLHTGYQRQGRVEYPSLGSLVASEQPGGTTLPAFVSIAPYAAAPAAYRPGFLGSQFAPLILRPARYNAPTDSGSGGESTLRVEYLAPPAGVDRARVESRAGLLRDLEADFSARQPDTVARSHGAAYDCAIRLMDRRTAGAFDLAEELPAVHEAYGGDSFGQGCLLARRLVERGVSFVEVTLGMGFTDWDTHSQNFPRVQELSGRLDSAWSRLLDDLASRGLLNSTMIIWMGEFGRTPKINTAGGRDHFPNAWTTVLAGGGIHGGQVIGRTSPDGIAVEDRFCFAYQYRATLRLCGWPDDEASCRCATPPPCRVGRATQPEFSMHRPRPADDSAVALKVGDTWPGASRFCDEAGVSLDTTLGAHWSDR